MNTNLTISVLMPAYNAAPYIAEAIHSILNQTFADFELIVIDDCSTDKTYQIVSELALFDSRIKVIKNAINLGIAGNRNKALSLARGKYIAWQDADDVSFPERLTLQYEFLERNSKVGIVGASLELFTDNQVLGYRHYPLTDELIRRTIFRYSPITQPAAMIRTDVLHQVGIYDLALPPAEDLDMTFRIGQLYQLGNVDQVLVRYRISETSATAVAQRRMEVNTLKIRFKYAKSGSYKVVLSDVIFNVAHLISLWFVPAGVKRWIFTKLRDEKQ